MNFEAIADALIALNNESPRLPRKEQIIEVLQAASVPMGGPNVIVRGCNLGASIIVVQDSAISTQGWHLALRQGWQPDPDVVTVAILDFLKDAILAKKAKATGPVH